MGKKKILIADDEANIRLLISSMLGKNYTVLTACDGEEAVDTARRQKPDLILLDVLMPKMDGFTACTAIKMDKATKGIPVLMLTGIGHELNKDLSRHLGADGYITKPFSMQYLLDMVGQFLPAS